MAWCSYAAREVGAVQEELEVAGHRHRPEHAGIDEGLVQDGQALLGAVDVGEVHGVDLAAGGLAHRGARSPRSRRGDAAPTPGRPPAAAPAGHPPRCGASAVTAPGRRGTGSTWCRSGAARSGRSAARAWRRRRRVRRRRSDRPRCGCAARSPSDRPCPRHPRGSGRRRRSWTPRSASRFSRKWLGAGSSTSVCAWARSTMSSVVSADTGAAPGGSVEEGEGSHLDARPRGVARRARGVGERGVRHATGAIGIGVVRLEHEHLVGGHVAEVVPLVSGVVHVARGVVSHVHVAELDL